MSPRTARTARLGAARACSSATTTETWVADEHERCDHGCGQWEHEHLDERIQCPREAETHEQDACAACNPGKAGKAAKICSACGKAYYRKIWHEHQCSATHVTSDESTTTEDYDDDDDDDSDSDE